MRDAIYEQALEKQGLTFEYEEALRLASVDVNRSLRNQARLMEPLDEALLAEYTASFEAGYKFPPLVVYKCSSRRFALADGNHRLEVYLRKGVVSADAYVVLNKDEKALELLTWSFNNAVNGRRISQAEAVEHAVTYVRKYRVPMKDAAAVWGLSASYIANCVRTEDAKDRLRSAGAERLPGDDTVKLLVTLESAGDDVMCAAADAVVRTGATRDDAEDLVRTVKRARTSEAKLAAVAEFAGSARMVERKAETRGGTARTPRNGPRKKFLRFLLELRALLEEYAPEALRPYGGDAERLHAAWASVSELAPAVLTAKEAV